MITVEASFNLRRTPFERDIPTNSLYLTPGTLELLSRLEYAAQKRSFVVITGDVGVGKSTVIRKFSETLESKLFRYVYITDSALRPRVFYWEVLTQLSDDAKPSFYRVECKRRMMAHMHRLLNEFHITPVVVIDESHLLAQDMLEETRFLLNNCMDSQNPMCLIIVGQSELRATLSKESYEPITQRIDFRFKLEAFDRAQSSEYIAAHMRYAGGDVGIFTDTALDEIYRYSEGRARKINKVCTLAMLYAAQRNKTAIDGADISFVVDQELTW